MSRFGLWVALLLACAELSVLGAKRSIVLPLHAKNLDAPAAGTRRKLLRNTTLPLHGAVKDYGYFYASLYLGTPPKKFAVIVDTGSTMTYVPCATCGSACGPNHQDAAFDPRSSRTSKYIPCDSDKCRCGSPHCACSDQQQCMYTRSYAEQSSSSGILLEDVVSLHDGGPGVPVIFGCETRETGEIFKQRADGLFGLGNSDASVFNQLVAAEEIDDVFSLCFGVVEGDGVLMLGDSPAAKEVQMQYTPMVPSPTHPFYYNVRLDAISVGGDQLDIAQSVFQEGYATVLDSGTTFTYIPTPAFQAFSAAVEAYALDHGLTRVRGPDPQYDDICFGGAPEHTDIDAMASVFPTFQLHFAADATLTLGPLNYLFVHTFNSGKYCLGVFDNGHAGTLLGGITFRNVLVQYDRANSRVGFGAAACKDLGQKHRPPCSAFTSPGNDLAAIVAVADGDCEPEPGLPDSRTEQIDDDYVDSLHSNEDEEHEVVMPTASEFDRHHPSGINEEESGDIDDEQEIVGADDRLPAKHDFNSEEEEEAMLDRYRDHHDDDGDGGGAHEEIDSRFGGPDGSATGSESVNDYNDDYHDMLGGGGGGEESVGTGDVDHNRSSGFDRPNIGTEDSSPLDSDSSNTQERPSSDSFDSFDDLSDLDGAMSSHQHDSSSGSTGQVQYDENDTNEVAGSSLEGGIDASGASHDHSTAIYASPLTIGLLAGTVAMLSSALIVAMFRPGSREALRSIIPGFKRYEALGGDDPESGSGGGGGGGVNGSGGASGGSGIVYAGKGLGGVSGGSVKSSSKGSNAGGTIAGGLLSSILPGSGKQTPPAIAVISMTELSSKAPPGLTEGSTRVVGLTTPQKLQRTNSNSAAAAAAALAEELAAMQGLTPRAGAAGPLGSSLPSASRMGPSRGPSTPTRMQIG